MPGFFLFATLGPLLFLFKSRKMSTSHTGPWDLMLLLAFSVVLAHLGDVAYASECTAINTVSAYSSAMLTAAHQVQYLDLR